jgi:hypothetical protein
MILRLASSMAAVVFAALAVIGCSNSPSSPSGSSESTGSVTVPVPALPAANASVRFVDQPVTLAVRNAAVTTTGTVYAFEVATDSAFASKMQTKDNVAEGANGQTSVNRAGIGIGVRF